MKITKKCPVCNEQVHIDSRFCVYCGVKLDGSPAPAPAAVVEPAAEDAAPCTGSRYCPDGHAVPDPSLGFCLVCGKALVDEPVTASAEPVSPVPETAEPTGTTVRTCKNGHTFDDPELMFCPECGVRYDEPVPEIPVREIREERSRGTEIAETPVTETPRAAAGFPAGLRPATEDDLIRK